MYRVTPARGGRSVAERLQRGDPVAAGFLGFVHGLVSPLLKGVHRLFARAARGHADAGRDGQALPADVGLALLHRLAQVLGHLQGAAQSGVGQQDRAQ